MAFALSIKSIIDFPENGKIFLVLTLIIALFTLLYSTFFLDCTLRKCEITNYCNADNFDENILSLKENCFDRFKVKIMNFNESYLKKCIKVPENLDNELSGEGNNFSDNNNGNNPNNYLDDDSSLDDIGMHLDYFRKKFYLNKGNNNRDNINRNRNNGKDLNNSNSNVSNKAKEMKSVFDLDLDYVSETDKNLDQKFVSDNLKSGSGKDKNKKDNKDKFSRRTYELNTDSDFNSNLSKDNFNDLNKKDCFKNKENKDSEKSENSNNSSSIN